MAEKVNVKRFKKLLEARQEEVAGLIDGAQDQVRPVELDQTRVGRLSRMDALQDQAMAQETERRRQNDLKRIDSALKRIADGDYGYCLLCDDPIPLKRLEFDPAVTTCVDCASS